MSAIFQSFRKKSKEFIWDDECDRVLTNLKAYLSNPPLIFIPSPNEQLFIYLSSSTKAVNGLVREDENV